MTHNPLKHAATNVSFSMSCLAEIKNWMSTNVLLCPHCEGIFLLYGDFPAHVRVSCKAKSRGIVQLSVYSKVDFCADCSCSDKMGLPHSCSRSGEGIHRPVSDTTTDILVSFKNVRIGA